MTAAPQNTVGTPVVYAGRFADEIRGAVEPGGATILDDWDVLPAHLAATARDAAAIVVLDALSFPFEALVGRSRNVPLVVLLPDKDAAFLSTVFGETVFEDLGFFDRFVSRDSAVWEVLRREFNWAERQRLVVGGGDLGSVATEILGRISGEDGRADKATQRVREAAILPRFAAARGLDPEESPMDVLQVGVGDGRWTGGFDLAGTRFYGVDQNRDAVVQARFNFPEGRFVELDDDLSLPYEDEQFDLVFSVGELGRHPLPAKRSLVSEMWRVARPGGRLLFLEDFVDGQESAPHTVSINAFRGVLMGATAGQIVLEHVESVRYPGEDVVRGGVVGLSRLGVARRW